MLPRWVLVTQAACAMFSSCTVWSSMLVRSMCLFVRHTIDMSDPIMQPFAPRSTKHRFWLALVLMCTLYWTLNTTRVCLVRCCQCWPWEAKGSACYGASVRLVKSQAGCQLGKAHNLDYFKLVTMIRRYGHPLDLSLAYQAWPLVYWSYATGQKRRRGCRESTTWLMMAFTRESFTNSSFGFECWQW